MLISFAFDNDDMESSKRRVTFLLLIFLVKCMSKSILPEICVIVIIIIESTVSSHSLNQPVLPRRRYFHKREINIRHVFMCCRDQE